jgi:hypothetical protein
MVLHASIEVFFKKATFRNISQLTRIVFLSHPSDVVRVWTGSGPCVTSCARTQTYRKWAWRPSCCPAHSLPALRPTSWTSTSSSLGTSALASRPSGGMSDKRKNIPPTLFPAFSGVVGDSAKPGTYDWGGVGDRFESRSCLIRTDIQTGCIGNFLLCVLGGGLFHTMQRRLSIDFLVPPCLHVSVPLKTLCKCTDAVSDEHSANR